MPKNTNSPIAIYVTHNDEKGNYGELPVGISLPDDVHIHVIDSDMEYPFLIQANYDKGKDKVEVTKFYAVWLG